MTASLDKAVRRTFHDLPASRQPRVLCKNCRMPYVSIMRLVQEGLTVLQLCSTYRAIQHDLPACCSKTRTS